MMTLGELFMEYRIQEPLSIMEKLEILTDAAKYDVACTSSGVERKGDGKGIGNSLSCGLCHTFAADGRCISLLKILFTNECIYDCRYCINRKSNDVKRTSFTPDEICELTIEFYRRNLIEGLFLSSGILRSPDYTMELIYSAIYKLRTEHRFQGYIHVKAIPGASPEIVKKLGFIVDRMSINLEFPTADGLKELCPNKNRSTILKPMKMIQNGITAGKNEVAIFKSAPQFVPAGQSTQMVIGATGETDYQIVNVAESLYKNFSLKRVFYSAFVNINNDSTLPYYNPNALEDKKTIQLPSKTIHSCSPEDFDFEHNHLGKAPLLREHRLYQADFLMRFYQFEASELLSPDKPNFNTSFDPKADWALKHLEHFPVEINKADYHTLLRVPGIGVKSAQRIVTARRLAPVNFDDLKRIGVVLKRALYFITCSGRMMYPTKIDENYIAKNLLNIKERLPEGITSSGKIYEQLTMSDYFGIAM